MSAGDTPDFLKTVTSPRQSITGSPVTIPAGMQSVKNIAIDVTMYGIAIAMVPAPGFTNQPSFIVKGHDTSVFYSSDVISTTHAGWYVVGGFATADKSLDITLNAANTDTTFYADAILVPLSIFTQEQANPLTRQGIDLQSVSGNGITIGQSQMSGSLPVVLPSDQVPSARMAPQKTVTIMPAGTGVKAFIPNGIGVATYGWTLSITDDGLNVQLVIQFQRSDASIVGYVALNGGGSFALEYDGAPLSSLNDNRIDANIVIRGAGGNVAVTGTYSQV